jgi:RNA polymerase sigma-70 factor, ECF subfamily
MDRPDAGHSRPTRLVRRDATAVDGTDSGSTPGGVADFDTLYAEQFPFVWRCLKSLGVPLTALDDAAQEVFVTVHRRLPSFRGQSAFRSWLYGIVRNVAANQRRTFKRKERHQQLEEEPPSPDAGPHERAQDREAAEFVTQFLDRLDDKKREVFLLAVLEQMSIVDVAEALSIPLNTAYTRFRNARLEFQQALARRGGPP